MAVHKTHVERLTMSVVLRDSTADRHAGEIHSNMNGSAHVIVFHHY